MATKIQVRRDTAANWYESNPVLSQGEPGLEIDTGLVKYGDGVTAWNNLSSQGNTVKVLSDESKWGVHTVSGVKEFTYVPRGHKWVETVAAATTTDGTYVVSATSYPDIAIVYDSYHTHNYNNFVFINGDYTTKIGVIGITHVGGNYTITVDGTPTITSGDRVTIMSWVAGTVTTYDDSYEWQDFRAVQNTSNSNIVQIDLSWTAARETIAVADPKTCSITFDDKPVNWINDGPQRLIDKSRNITKIEQVSGNTYSFTFSGPPISVKTDDEGFTISANSSLDTSGLSYVAVSRTLYPELANYVYYSGGQISVNGETIDIYGAPDAYGDKPGVFDDITYYGDNWIINLVDPVTECLAGDTVTISWNKPGTSISIWTPVPGGFDYLSTPDNAYQWFDWKKDLPTFNLGSRSNGVISGKIDWAIKVVREYDNSTDSQTSYGNWAYSGYTGYSLPQTIYFSTKGNSNQSRWFGRSDGVGTRGTSPDSASGGLMDADSNAFYYWGPEGIFFREYPYGNRSEPIKVKIAYKMDLFLGEDTTGDWD